jgi:hypothetical protein
VNPTTDKGYIVGKVADSAGVVADATVVVNSLDPKNAFNAQVTTGADGNYRVDNVPAGVQMVVNVRKTGYQERSQVVTVGKDQPAGCDFTGDFQLVKQ